MTQEGKQKRNRTMKRRKIITSALLIIVFFLLSIYSIIRSDFFNLKKITITGNDQVLYEEIVDLSGLLYNRNIFQYNLDEIAFNIEKHSYIEKAEIKKKLPNSLIVTINEREKYAIIPYMGRYINIDDKLYILEVNDEYYIKDLALITGVKIDSILIGEKVHSSNDIELEYILKIFEATKLVSINHMISEINIKENGIIALIMINGIEVLININNDPAYTIVTLKQLLTTLTNNEKDIIIDMRFEGGFSIREKQN